MCRENKDVGRSCSVVKKFTCSEVFALNIFPKLLATLSKDKPEILCGEELTLLKVKVKPFHSDFVLPTSCPASGAIRFDNADNGGVNADR